MEIRRFNFEAQLVYCSTDSINSRFSSTYRFDSLPILDYFILFLTSSWHNSPLLVDDHLSTSHLRATRCPVEHPSIVLQYVIFTNFYLRWLFSPDFGVSYLIKPPSSSRHSSSASTTSLLAHQWRNSSSSLFTSSLTASSCIFASSTSSSSSTAIAGLFRARVIASD